MPDYDLSRLGTRAFEQMVVALARKEIGPGVRVFGDGPDGGREATFDGTINWSATSQGVSTSADSWVGYTVLQSKFQIKPKPEPRDNAVWLQGEISREITKWAEAAENKTRSRLPRYLIFITNVDLSSVAETGGIDTLTSFIRGKLQDTDLVRKGLLVEDFAIWHADQIRSMLDAHQDVRWAYPGLLTVGDVLSRLGSASVPLGSMDLQDPLREELLRSVRLDRWVRLSQAGGPGDSKLWLDDIAIDLPALLDDDRESSAHTVRHVLQLGDCVLRQRQPDRIGRPNVVIVGGPGQGKSTLSQLIAQAYRVSMLTDVDLGPSVKEIVDGTRTALDRLGLAVPQNRRWPVRVDLAKYAEELSAGTDTTLLRWISSTIQKRTEQDIQPAQLRSWLRAWPWALILDGLDEVPSVRSRRLVYHQIDDLLTTAEDLDADLLVVVTTRPTGYDERFPSERYQHAYLQRLPAKEAAEYSQRITDRRFADDDEMRRKVADRMRDASLDPVTSKLMETPLQVMIMSFIVEKYPNLPPDRFTLFNLYYQTVCDRETAKEIPIARFLAENRQRIDRLHEEVGLVLQVQSEAAEGAEAALDPEQLGELARRQLRERGFQADAAADYARQLVDAATMRLVLLTPREGGVGFEVRSLQELMAARAITEGHDADVVARLRLIAHSPHWRNTWLLAAGRLLVTSERFERVLIGILRDLDTDPRRLSGRFPTAPLLAADIVEDNLAVRRPNFEKALIQRMFTVLERPPVVGLDRIAKAMLGIAKTPYRAMVFDRLASVATGSAASRAAAVLILFVMRTMTRENGPLTSIRLAGEKIQLSEVEQQAMRGWLSVYDPDTPPRPTAGGQEIVKYLLAQAASTGLVDPDLELLRDGLEMLANANFHLVGPEPSFAVVELEQVGDPLALLLAVENDDVAISLELALDTAPSSHWAIEAVLGLGLKPASDRLAVGHRVIELVTESRSRSSALDDLIS
ncbi:hypothetical protein AB0B66_10125 [Catellatospora sp. NPDC049111]|uniref:NACHT domain-containing protein n=1 Tax=Catellatospora sp. NPDC049111 TaxID=3155271 RepID=UPI0033D8410E